MTTPIPTPFSDSIRESAYRVGYRVCAAEKNAEIAALKDSSTEHEMRAIYLETLVKELVEVGEVALHRLHELHSNQERIAVGVGICQWSPCVRLRETLTKARGAT